jgi:hypothetical protein
LEDDDCRDGRRRRWRRRRKRKVADGAGIWRVECFWRTFLCQLVLGGMPKYALSREDGAFVDSSEVDFDVCCGCGCCIRVFMEVRFNFKTGILSYE